MLRKTFFTLFSFLFIGFSNLAIAAEGFYISAQGALTAQRLDSGTTSGGASITTKEKANYGGRVALGYESAANVSLELGWTYYGEAKWSTNGVSPSGDLRYRASALDLLAKFRFPVEEYFSLFVKGGGAAIFTKTDRTITANTDFSNLNSNTTSYRPKVALGGAYHFNDHLSLDLTLSRIFGAGNVTTSKRYVPDLDMLAVGLLFKF